MSMFNCMIGAYRGLSATEKVRLFIVSLSSYCILGMGLYLVLYTLASA